MPKDGFLYEDRSQRGWFGIGIEFPKYDANVGSLWRTAHAFNADFIFTIGERYNHMKTDTAKVPRHIPCWNFADFKSLMAVIPNNCDTVGVELDNRSRPLERFVHPPRGLYILGAEDFGLSPDARKSCRHLIKLPTHGSNGPSINVAACGSIICYDRYIKSMQNANNS